MNISPPQSTTPPKHLHLLRAQGRFLSQMVHEKYGLCCIEPLVVPGIFCCRYSVEQAFRKIVEPLAETYKLFPNVIVWETRENSIGITLEAVPQGRKMQVIS
jgi:hypothetical protein